MSQKAYVKAPKAALIGGIITTVLFLIFGIVFFVVLMKEGSIVGMAFAILWILVVLLIGGFYYYNLINYKNEEKNTAGEIVITGSASGSDFDDKLRKLEGLKKDKLITEEEYRKKREEIVKKEW